METARTAVARCVLGGSQPSRVRFYSASGRELASLPDLHRERAAVAVSDGRPLRAAGAGVPPSPGHVEAARATARYPEHLVGGEVLRLDASDPELPSLLRSPVPVVVAGSRVAGRAPELWSFDYLDRALSDVDNFYVLCAPSESRGRFAYYDMGETKNPCRYELAPSNERKEMRFPEFRRRVAEAQKKRKGGKKAGSYYLQNTLLHREESEPGPPKPVGGFGVTCAVNLAKDIQDFDWDWLMRVMGGRHPQMCQFFCGTEGGFSPCHYDPQDNLFAQVRGYKRVLLFHPRHFAALYPWPVHHPQDRQSRVDFDRPDAAAFPRFQELVGRGLVAILGPGDALRIPPGWWHHIEMLPSPPAGEVVSINFWYPSPKWFYGDLMKGEITWDRPLFGVRRVLFQRCVEELLAQGIGPGHIPEVLKVCVGTAMVPAKLQAAVQSVRDFVGAVLPDIAQQRELLREVLDGRFAGLRPQRTAAGGA